MVNVVTQCSHTGIAAADSSKDTALRVNELSGSKGVTAV